MKIITIIGSPNGVKGRSGTLAELVLGAAAAAGAQTEVFSLGDLTVLPCCGCTAVCHTTGLCRQNDDFARIRDAMLQADGIVFASPNYNLGVSAQMKALIDRCGLLLHCQRLNGKYAGVVVASGGSDPEVVESYLRNILTMYGFWVVGSLGSVEMQFEDDEEREKLSAEAQDLGRRMVAAANGRDVYAEQSEARDQAFEIMKFMVMTLREKWPFAWDYWKAHWEAEGADTVGSYDRLMDIKEQGKL